MLALCGPGNNGGDGLVASRILARTGWPVRVARLGEANFTAAEAARADLVIDAVFGAGLTRDVAPEIGEVSRAARRVVAIDVPSGVDGATGAVRGSAPQAVLTITFHRLKPGHLLLPGRELCGETVLADIALPEAATPIVQTFRNSPRLWTIPSPTRSGHKYSRGHASVLGGAEMTGAARMAAVAARRAGAGLVTIAAGPEAGALYRAGEPGRSSMTGRWRSSWATKDATPGCAAPVWARTRRARRCRCCWRVGGGWLWTPTGSRFARGSRSGCAVPRC